MGDMKHAGGGRRVALLLAMALLLLSGCSGHAGQSDDADWHGDANMARSADSLEQYVRGMLDEPGMAASQRAMLERAMEHGGQVSRADYLTAWDDFRQCIRQRGYADPPLLQLNGLYVKQIASTVEGMTQAQQDKLDEDLMECRTAHVLQVDAAYRASQGNAELYSDPGVALVDCLRRGSLVPRGYTVARFQEEYESRIAMAGTGGTPEEFGSKLESAFSFDLDDPAVQTCVVSDDPDLVAHRLETWHPLGDRSSPQ